MEKKKTIQSIDRAVEILNYIATHDNETRLIDMSNDLNIKKSTLHGILSTLEYNKLIYQNKDNSKYSLGIKLYELGKVYEQHFSLKKIIRPYMEELGESFSETVHLAVESNFMVLYIDRFKSPYSVRMSSEVGSKDPLYCSSIGKLILANSSDEYINTYLDNTDLIKRTENTITDRTLIIEELEKIKNNGYSIDQEELETGLICVSAPIKNKKEELIAVLSISGPKSRINDETFSNMKSSLINKCTEISELMRYKEI